MNENEFAELFAEAFEDYERRLEEASSGKVFLADPVLMHDLERMIEELDCTCEVSFNAVCRSIDLHLESPVFDSCISSIGELMSRADFFVIDALNDGTVCIELRFRNAAKMI